MAFSYLLLNSISLKMDDNNLFNRMFYCLRIIILLQEVYLALGSANKKK